LIQVWNEVIVTEVETPEEAMAKDWPVTSRRIKKQNVIISNQHKHNSHERFAQPWHNWDGNVQVDDSTFDRYENQQRKR
jgi:hypothetical protein